MTETTLAVSLTQELIDWLYETVRYDERGDGAFRFWRCINGDAKATGLLVYVFYDGLCFQVSHTMNPSVLTP